MRFGLILVAMLAACSPVKDLNRVGNNYVDKALFEGEWHHQGVIVDKGFNQSGAFIGSQGDLDRVKFEVTEKLLIAYRSYEKVAGAEAANPGKQTWVAAFPIIKHFDIKRRYNDQNGIEDNVIIENDSDRPWSERKYVRVDWSTNVVADAQFNDFVKTESIQSVARNSLGADKEPFRVRVQPGYFETTVDALAKPYESVCSYIGDWNCSPSRVRIKYSFKKTDENNQYEKMLYPDYLPLLYGQTAKKELCVSGDEGCTNMKELWLAQNGTELCDPKRHAVDECEQYQVPVFSRFGYFRTERNKFDREEGFTHSGREQLINRWNIWKATKRADGTPIPIAEREPKAIVYYLNATFPQDLFTTSQKMAEDWNTAFVSAVAAAKSMSASAVSERFGKLFQIRLNDCNIHNLTNYVKEHNLEAALHAEGLMPVEIGNLEQGCAFIEWLSEKKGISPVFTWQELGDLRYSFLNYTTKAELAGPLGYGPSSTDPLTGEIIGANANIYGASIDVYAARGADIVAMMNGQISSEDIMNGTQVRNQLNSVRRRFAEDISEADVEAFSSLVDQRITSIPKDEYIRAIPETSFGKNLEFLRTSGFEDQYLITDEMTRLLSTGGKNIDRARPSVWAQPSMPALESLFGQHQADMLKAQAQGKPASFIQEFERREDFLGKHSVCFSSDAIEPAVAELAANLSGKSWDQAFQYIREEIFRGTATHELGHTFGLRHNFEASADPLNYFPNFWDVDTGDERMSRSNNRKSELKYSSIMDYHQRFNSDFAGIGLYDRAAIKFGYAGTIEVFDETKTEFVPRGWFSNMDMFNYKDLPLLYSGDGVDDKLDKHYDQVRSQFRRGDDSARINVKSLKINAKPENLFKRKDIPFSLYYRGLLSRLFGVETQNAAAAFEVPYKYCSDAFASGSSMTCNRWDMGANAEEIVDNAAQMYEAYYLFNSFRGEKMQMNPSSYMARLYSGTYQPMLSAFRYMYYYRRSSLRIWPLMQDWTAASLKGLNFFGRVLQTVDPGRYCLTDGKLYLPENEVSNCIDPVNIGVGQGKYFDTIWNDDFFFKPHAIGHMYDKLLAIRALTDNTTFFTRDFSSNFNRGAYSIGYYRVFAPEMIQLFGSILQDNVYDYAPEISVENGTAAVHYRDIVNTRAEIQNASSVRIKPSQSWTMRYYSLVFPMIHYSSSVDRQLDFAKRVRITLVGSKNDPSVDASIPQAFFTDPHTHMQYRSVAVESEKVSPGFQIVQDAQAFINDGANGKAVGPWKAAKDAASKARADFVTIRASNSDKSVLRTTREQLDKAERDLRYYDAKLQEKIQFIEVVKRLGDLLEYSN